MSVPSWEVPILSQEIWAKKDPILSAYKLPGASWEGDWEWDKISCET